MSSSHVIEQVETGNLTSGVFFENARRSLIRDVCLPIKAGRCEEHRSSSSLPNLLSLMKAFVSERGRGALGATAIFIFQSSTQKPTLPGS